MAKKERRILTKKMKEVKNVKPIVKTEDIEDFVYAIERNAVEKNKRRHMGVLVDRDYMLFRFGSNTGLRVSDILKLTISEVRRKRTVKVMETKTRKTKDVHLGAIYEELNNYCDKLQAGGYTYLFPSIRRDKPISRIMAYQIMKEAASTLGVDGIGTHTMRKTYARQMYEQTGSVALLMRMMNHKTEQETLDYIGVTTEEIAQAHKGLDIGRSKKK